MKKKRYFIGTQKVKIDAKNRITVPSKFYDVMKENYAEESNKVVVTFWFERSLAVFPEESYNDFIAFLELSSEFDPKTRDLYRIFIEGATEVFLDSQNRVKIPQFYFDKTGIEKEAIVTGDKDKMLIRESVSWEKNLDSALLNLSDIAESMYLSTKKQPEE